MIQCNKVSKSYAKNIALNNLSFSMKKGEILGLLGINGAGKSTLIKIILGFLRPDTGEIIVNAPSIGYMPEIAKMPETVSPLAFVRFALRLRQSNTTDAELCLINMKLSETAWNKPIRQLSKGMRQRTALAFALAGSPKFLVLDEPMSGLDAVGRVHLIELLQQRQQEGSSVLICSHIVPDLVRLTNRVLFMGQGKILTTFDIQKHDLDEIDMLEKSLAQRSGL